MMGITQVIEGVKGTKSQQRPDQRSHDACRNRADRKRYERIRQVLLNLMANAIKDGCISLRSVLAKNVAGERRGRGTGAYRRSTRKDLRTLR